MRRIYMVTFQRFPGEDYRELEEELKEFRGWLKYTKNCWLIYTNKTPYEICKKIYPYFDNDEELLVMEVKENYDGWLSSDVLDWLEEKFGELNE